MKNYETPELVDLGDARDLTLGLPNLDVVDACDCSKKCSCGGEGDIIA